MQVQRLLMSATFRVYTHTDVIGVELGGVLKNIVALGAGLGDGLGLGDNAKAAFMTRGLAEIARLGVAAGAQALTFAGLAGVGDVVATCSSRLSRNRRTGEQLARGVPLATIQAQLGGVAEGVPTTRAARILARRLGVEMPITELMYAVLFEGKDPRAASVELMARDPKHELEGLGPSVGLAVVVAPHSPSALQRLRSSLEQRSASAPILYPCITGFQRGKLVVANPLFLLQPPDNYEWSYPGRLCELSNRVRCERASIAEIHPHLRRDEEISGKCIGLHFDFC